MRAIFDDIIRTLDTLETLDAAGQADLLQMRALETGGTFKTPRPGNAWDSQRYEMNLHGVFAEGGDLRELVRNWTKAAHHAASVGARRQAELAEAETVITFPGGADTEALQQACAKVLELENLAHPRLADRARALQTALARADRDTARDAQAMTPTPL
ncbi:hypothetical protein N0B44_15735 [Roseibacterium beibuensis]|uniref:Uncharacterized protein n=1 Tax=[Roseibacterium] beibuensis TaxID=1193142 RepID=A0ABP9LD39_9RHOB|nr:hypothetical protein [Roseibacterium beibuensis]MCS6624370.1 hypothetical protein [Roseibacterium beibuensis]